MLEIPESAAMAEQLSNAIIGRRIQNVIIGASPHKFAWFLGEPEENYNLLINRTITGAQAVAGTVDIMAEDVRINVIDGVNIRYYPSKEAAPAKHQMYLEFDDGSALVFSVQMYGGMIVFREGAYDSPYYAGALSKPNPLTDEFSEAYYRSLYDEGSGKLSAKAFLATKQRIPGLGNGVLQDILWNAGIHPKRKIATLSEDDRDRLFASIKDTLTKMALSGGRDNERDLYGAPGGYQTVLSSKTVGKPCPACGDTIKKEAYLGGAIYYCETCQPL